MAGGKDWLAELIGQVVKELVRGAGSAAVSALVAPGKGPADVCPHSSCASCPDCKLEVPATDLWVALIIVVGASILIVLAFCAGLCLGSLRRTSPAPTRAPSGPPQRKSKDDRVLFNAAAGSW